MARQTRRPKPGSLCERGRGRPKRLDGRAGGVPLQAEEGGQLGAAAAGA